MIIDLNKNTFTLYAAKCYDKPNYIMSEFDEDIKYFKYVKKLVKKVKSKNIVQERLILNHIVFLHNVFGLEATRMLFYKLDPEDYDILKTFLVFLNYLPKIIYGINGKNINTADIPINIHISNMLRKI